VYRRLVNRLDEQFVNVYVRRAAGNPDQNFRDVFRRQGIYAFVNFFRRARRRFENARAKILFRQAGINRADANTGCRLIPFAMRG